MVVWDKLLNTANNNTSKMICFTSHHHEGKKGETAKGVKNRKSQTSLGHNRFHALIGLGEAIS